MITKNTYNCLKIKICKKSKLISLICGLIIIKIFDQTVNYAKEMYFLIRSEMPQKPSILGRGNVTEMENEF